MSESLAVTRPDVSSAAALEEPFDPVSARPLNVIGWCDRHGADAASLSGITGRPRAGQAVYALPEFGAAEHRELGQSVQRALNTWALAGLLDGGALIRVATGNDGIARSIDAWDFKLPDASNPTAPYGGLNNADKYDWHYIVPNALFDPATKQRWTEASLRTAIKRGNAAVMTFGQLVFLAGDLVGTFEDLHKPHLYARPRNIMEAVEAESPLARELLVAMLHPPQGNFDKLNTKDELEKAKAGKKVASQTSPQLLHVRYGFKKLEEPTPFGTLQLCALLLAVEKPIGWPQIEALAPWFDPGKIDIDRLRQEKLPSEFLAVILTNGLYLELAMDNTRHFAPDNWNTFDAGFRDAADRIAKNMVGIATSPSSGPIPADAAARLAFACHFLTDAFSSGHMRVPRAKLGRTGGVLAKVMHDIDGECGLTVKNGFGRRWRAYGDGDLHGPDSNSIGAKLHGLFEKRVGADFDRGVTANCEHALAAVHEAVVLLHYEAQRHRDVTSSATYKTILDKARLPKGKYLTDDLLLREDTQLGDRTAWLNQDIAAKCAYLRKHRPEPLPVGKTLDLNHPPLVDGNLRPDAGVYSRDSKLGDRQYLVMVWRGLVDTFNITEMYLLSRLGQGAKLPGIPEDVSLLAALKPLKTLSLRETTDRVVKSQQLLVPAHAAQAGEPPREIFEPTSSYRPVIDATLFHCAPTPPGVLAAALLPLGARDADAETRYGLRAAGLSAAQLTEFDGQHGVAALQPIGSFFGGAAFAELLRRLRYTPAQIRNPPTSYSNVQASLGITRQQALAPRVLLAIPGYFRELARRAATTADAFAFENLGWLVAHHLRDTMRDSRGIWWLPPAPDWVTPFANPTPDLSAAARRLVGSIFNSQRVATLQQYNEQFARWRNGLPGRLWARETGNTAGVGGPGRAWYADLVPTAAVNITAERAVITRAWESFRDSVEQQHGVLTDASADVLAGSCNDGVIPTQYQNSMGQNVALFGKAALGGLRWTLKFPLRQPTGTSSDLRSSTKILAALEATTGQLMATMSELGWNDLVFHTAGAFCVRGRRRGNVTPQKRRELARLLSNHGSATAIDLNVFENPASGTQTTFDARAVALFESCNFRWGRCFSDPHHFEYT